LKKKCDIEGKAICGVRLRHIAFHLLMNCNNLSFNIKKCYYLVELNEWYYLIFEPTVKKANGTVLKKYGYSLHGKINKTTKLIYA
jgi:hypothetical protein